MDKEYAQKETGEARRHILATISDRADCDAESLNGLTHLSLSAVQESVN